MKEMIGKFSISMVLLWTFFPHTYASKWMKQRCIYLLSSFKVFGNWCQLTLSSIAVLIYKFQTQQENMMLHYTSDRYRQPKSPTIQGSNIIIAFLAHPLKFVIMWPEWNNIKVAAEAKPLQDQQTKLATAASKLETTLSPF